MYYLLEIHFLEDSPDPGSLAGKESTCNAGDPASIPGLERSPGKGIGNPLRYSWVSLVAQSVKTACSVGDLGSIPGLERSPGERNGYPLQYSGLENSMDRGAWQATVHGVAKSRTRLSDFHFHQTHVLSSGSSESCCLQLRDASLPDLPKFYSFGKPFSTPV